MNRKNNEPQETSSSADPAAACIGLPPPDFIELTELRCASIERRLGYFRSEPFVIFGYCPGGGEVIWKDGHSSGFGTGGWKILLQELAPMAARHGVFLGDLTRAGTHVLVMDRTGGKIYAAPREPAEEFMAEHYGIPASHRRCLCSLLGCTMCPLHDGCKDFPDDIPSKVVAPLQKSRTGTSRIRYKTTSWHERTTR
jgi:hypothetical protein